MLLLLGASRLILYGYVIWRRAWAIALRSWRSTRFWLKRLWPIAALFNLYPAVASGGYLLDAAFWRTALRGGQSRVDARLTYPFWIGLRVALQLYLKPGERRRLKEALARKRLRRRMKREMGE